MRQERLPRCRRPDHPGRLRLAFPSSAPAGGPLAAAAALLFLFAFRSGRRRSPAPRAAACFVPFAAGLLVWPLRLFYWDRLDLSLRIRNLLAAGSALRPVLPGPRAALAAEIPAPFQFPEPEKKDAGHFPGRGTAVRPGRRPADAAGGGPGGRRTPLPGHRPVPGPRRRPQRLQPVFPRRLQGIPRRQETPRPRHLGQGLQEDLFLPPARRGADRGPLLFFQALAAAALFSAARLPGAVRRPAGRAGLPVRPAALALAQPGLFRHAGLQPGRPGLFLLLPYFPRGPGHAAGAWRPLYPAFQMPRQDSRCLWAGLLLGSHHILGGQVRPLHLPRSPSASAAIGCGKNSSAGPCCCSSSRCSFRPSSFFTCTAPTAASRPTPSITACSIPRSRRRSSTPS